MGGHKAPLGANRIRYASSAYIVHSMIVVPVIYGWKHGASLVRTPCC